MMAVSLIFYQVCANPYSLQCKITDNMEDLSRMGKQKCLPYCRVCSSAYFLLFPPESGDLLIINSCGMSLIRSLILCWN